MYLKLKAACTLFVSRNRSVVLAINVIIVYICIKIYMSKRGGGHQYCSVLLELTFCSQIFYILSFNRHV